MMSTHTPRSQRGRPVKCTSCDRPLASPLFCDQCHSLYPADGVNHFELLGVETTYDLAPAALRQKYLQVSRGVHPDYHGTADSALSLRLSAQLNEAHRVLSDPVLRAEYLLELHGGKSARDDKSVPQDVLNTSLLLREEIQEARQAGDAAALEQTRAEVRRHFDETLARVAELARQLPGDDSVRQHLRTALNSLKYHQKLLAEL
jgi:molecular chaperone HscB